MLLSDSVSVIDTLVGKVKVVVCSSTNIVDVLSQRRSLDIMTPRYFVWLTFLGCSLCRKYENYYYACGNTNYFTFCRLKFHHPFSFHRYCKSKSSYNGLASLSFFIIM